MKQYRYDEFGTISNPITDYDLLCADKSAIGLIGLCFFAGIIVGALIFPRAADIVGRKPVILLGFILHVGIMGALLFCQGLKPVLYIAVFLLGLKALMNSHIAYVLLMEIVPAGKRNQYGSLILTLDSLW